MRYQTFNFHIPGVGLDARIDAGFFYSDTTETKLPATDPTEDEPPISRCYHSKE